MIIITNHDLSCGGRYSLLLCMYASGNGACHDILKEKHPEPNVSVDLECSSV